MTKKQLEVRMETINTLIAVFGDADGKLEKELLKTYKQMEEEKMNKQEKIKKLIANEIVIEATSPWDGEARFDYYSVVVHKYDNEDLSFIEENDPRIAEAAGRIFKMIDPKEWDRLLEYYLSDEPYVHPEGERNARPRGGRK